MLRHLFRRGVKDLMENKTIDIDVSDPSQLNAQLSNYYPDVSYDLFKH